MTIVPGSYVLIQATDNSRYPAEVIQVIDSDLEKFYRNNKLWPEPYDIEGHVEQLAEKLEIKNKTEQIERLKTEIKNITNKQTKTKKSSPKKVPHSSKKEPPQKKAKGKKGEPIPTTSRNHAITEQKQADEGCKTCNPICIPLPLKTTSTESNTENVTLSKKLTNSSGLKPALSGTSSYSGSSVGSGPIYSNITIDRDRLPPLYGICTPWQATKKEIKKLKK